MYFLYLTFLSCMLNFTACEPAFDYQSSSPTKILGAVNNQSDGTIAPKANNIIFQSIDGGLTWNNISKGLPQNEQSDAFFVDESTLYLRIKNEIYKSTVNSSIWEKVVGLNAEGPILKNGWVKDMVEFEGVLIGKSQQGIIRSTDNGESWESVISEGGVGIAVENIDGGVAAISYNTESKTRRVRISLDKGKTWKAIDEGLPPSLSISSIIQMGEYFICGHPDGIFRTSNMGKTWEKILPSVDEKVFNVYKSGKVLYALPRDGGC